MRGLMKLIAITPPTLRPGEEHDICRLLDRGWARVHIRKPEADARDVAAMLGRIPPRYRASLSLHDHFDIAAELGIGGVHLNARNPLPPDGWRGTVSRSCHSIDELERYASLDYLFLSPVYDSISKQGYKGRFSPDALAAAGVNLERVFALGGVTYGRLTELCRAGFGGAAMLSEAWKVKSDMLQFITDTDRGLEAVLRGGCRWVQLRMKDATDEEFADTARRVIPLCRRYGATVIFDDRVHLVAALGADGVHIGKKDMPVPEARAMLGQDTIIGATANTANDIMDAAGAGADYIGLGPFRFTTTKKGLAPILGLEGYRSIMSQCRSKGMTLPVVAIGGILTEDLPAIRETGVDGIAVSGLIRNSDNPETTTKEIIDTWKN